MRKHIDCARCLVVIAACALAAVMAGCADEDGLHNNDAPTAMVTFHFSNMGQGVNGDYAIPGDYANGNDWDNETTLVKMTAGEGTSEPIEVKQSHIKFSLVKTKDWSRLSWYPAVKGNEWDEGRAQNFSIGDLPLSSGEFTIEVAGDGAETVPVVAE